VVKVREKHANLTPVGVQKGTENKEAKRVVWGKQQSVCNVRGGKVMPKKRERKDCTKKREKGRGKKNVSL